MTSISPKTTSGRAANCSVIASKATVSISHLKRCWLMSVWSWPSAAGIVRFAYSVHGPVGDFGLRRSFFIAAENVGEFCSPHW